MRSVVEPNTFSRMLPAFPGSCDDKAGLLVAHEDGAHLEGRSLGSDPFNLNAGVHPGSYRAELILRIGFAYGGYDICVHPFGRLFIGWRHGFDHMNKDPSCLALSRELCGRGKDWSVVPFQSQPGDNRLHAFPACPNPDKLDVARPAGKFRAGQPPVRTASDGPREEMRIGVYLRKDGGSRPVAPGSARTGRLLGI
ncbi:hypothetical protein DES43_12058 [Aquamicrobium defluvii]|uniref:Uncharacterized protein n=1 Tax=Aquamicrobium defluvii TaxID=69279 RepID=A0A4R6YCZ3_9HYPH|nr:hypothetical protein CF98_27730 [Halopseudomonas bauzanensis]TDR33658.1 hypothetical protein DES43_12058 [Aquamicrobium defluvii]